METIYRLEHRNLKHHNAVDYFPTMGTPYSIKFEVSYITYMKKYSNIVNRLFNLHNECDENGKMLFPPPNEDGLNGVFDEFYFCACPTLDDLYDWFEGMVSDWLEVGFVIREYKVKSSLIGNSKKQCIFHFEDFISRRIVKT